MPEEFFADKRGAAVLKHGILHRYLHVFASKTGASSVDGRVTFLDGYAGPGAYQSGDPGSPLLAAATAAKLESCRTLHGIYVEQDRASFELLKTALSGTHHDHTLMRGGIEEHLPRALELAGATPLFAFFDPFGLPLPISAIHQVLSRARLVQGKRAGPATEVLISFMYPALRRCCGHLDSKSADPTYLKARATMVETLNAALGGEWWQSVWQQTQADSPETRVRMIARQYMDQITEGLDGNWGWYRVVCQNSHNAPPLYELLFITTYPKEGLWHFNEAVSLALEEYHEFCTRGQLPIDEKGMTDATMVREVTATIERILAEKAEFVMAKEITELTQTSIGRPRTKHFRKALSALFKSGRVSTDSKGDLQHKVVRRAR